MEKDCGNVRVSVSNQEALNDPLVIGLQEGPMTVVTPEIKELSDRIPGEGLDYIKNVRYWIHDNFFIPDRYEDLPDRFSRTAHEILFSTGESDKKVLGTCSEHAKVMRSLLIAKGIPSIWVDTLEQGFIDGKYPKGTYSGHVFLDVYVNGNWHILNPVAYPKSKTPWCTEKISTSKYVWQNENKEIAEFIPVARGVDQKSLTSSDGVKLNLESSRDWDKFADRFKKTGEQ